MKTLLSLLLFLSLSANDAAAPDKERFVNVNRLIPSLYFDMRYASDENFIGQPIELPFEKYIPMLHLFNNLFIFLRVLFLKIIE